MSDRPQLLCVGLDAVAIREVTRCVPEAQVHVPRRPEEVLRALAVGVDLVVCGTAGPLVAILGKAGRGVPTLALVADGAAAPDLGVTVVLRRPVDRATLQRTIRSLFSESDEPRIVFGWLRRRLFDPASSWDPERVFALLRLSVLAFVVVDLLGASIGPGIRVILGDATAGRLVSVTLLAAGHALLRVRWPSLGLVMVSVDAGVWLVAMALVGVVPSPFLLLMVLVFAELGHTRRPGALFISAGVGAALTAMTVAGGGVTDLVIVLPLLLLAGLLGVGIAVVVRGPDLVGHRALLEVQASLTGLHDHARRHPGRLEIGRVRREAVLAVRAAIEPDRVLLLDLGGVDGLSVTDLGIGERASFEAWSRGPSLAVAQRAAGVVSDHELLDMVGGGRLVLGAPMSVNGHARGLLMVAWDDEPGPARRRERCRRLEELADDAALAMENAELFEAINNLSATGERNRLARELHDGIIQSFVHVGFELERLARDVADLDVSTAMRIVDLRNVVGDAVSETRSVVSHLRRDEVSGEGLDGAVRRWLQASPATGGPTIRFTPEPMLLPPEVVPDLLRVTQQAVANARQHAHAATVRITTVARGADFVLVIEDDGRGSTATSARLGGVGLQSMAERLERLGGDLMVEPVDPTGTRVTATLPGILMIGAAA